MFALGTAASAWFGWPFALTAGCAAVSAYKLPQPDATIGRTRGWLPETIDRWNTQRPGRGVGGGRPRKNKTE